MISAIVPLMVCFLACGNSLHARPSGILPYSELFEQAELVLIARPISTRDSKPGDPVVEVVFNAEVAREYLTSVVSNCKVLSVVKGNLKDTEVTIPHYRFDFEKDEANGRLSIIISGPRLVDFALPKNKKDINDVYPGRRDYMVFLKREPDGDLTF